jgi:hypothetical protein
MTKTMMLLAAAALLLPACAARAGDIPGGPNTTAKLAIGADPFTQGRGTFEIAGDSDWYRVKLLARHDYAIAGQGPDDDGAPALAIRGSGGGILASRQIGSGELDGLEFRAPYTGTFFVEMRAAGPGTYYVGVSHDCQAGPATACLLRIGETRRAAFAFYQDSDWLKMQLTGGSSYDLSFASDAGRAAHCLAVRDASGAVLLASQCAADVGSPVVAHFTPTTSGTYFAEVVEQDEDVTVAGYSVSLAAGQVSSSRPRRSP